MPLSDVVKRFPRICKIEGEIKFPGGSITLVRSENVEQNLRDCNDVQRRTKLSTFSEADYPEMSGVSSVDLEFTRNELASIKIGYEESGSSDFATGFNPKIRELLGLSQWTNWKTEKTNSMNAERDVRRETETNKLLCNKVTFETELYSLELLRIPNDANVNRAIAEARLGKKSHNATLTISETDKAAVSTTDQERLSGQAEAEQRSKELEDRKKAETFKP